MGVRQIEALGFQIAEHGLMSEVEGSMVHRRRERARASCGLLEQVSATSSAEAIRFVTSPMAVNQAKLIMRGHSETEP
jgi:hypothetical protein